MERVIYYSGFGAMMKEKNIYDFVLDLKILSLLGDKVLITARHLIACDIVKLERLKELNLLFEKGILFTQIPSTNTSIEEYYCEKIERMKSRIDRQALLEHSRIIREDILGGKEIESKYIIKFQNVVFHEMITNYIEVAKTIRDSSKNKILTYINTQFDNESISKEKFDEILSNKMVKGLLHAEIEELINTSDVFYYVVGSITNSAIVSDNAFLENLNIGKYHPDEKLSTNEFYDPEKFIYILKALNIINDSKDIQNLSAEDILYLRKDKIFKKFIDDYFELSRTCRKFESIIIDLKDSNKKYEKIKDLFFSSALAVPEYVASLGFADPFVGMIFPVVLISIKYQCSRIKFVKKIRRNTTDYIIDRISYSSQSFNIFCQNLKQYVESMR